MKLDRRIALVWTLVVVLTIATIAAVAMATDADAGQPKNDTEVTQTPEAQTPPSTENDMMYPQDHPCDGQRYPQDDCPPLDA